MLKAKTPSKSRSITFNILILIISVMISSAITSTIYASKLSLPENSDWYGRYIYFIMTDRFKDGDRCNNFQVDKHGERTRHGGDISGIIQSLDYLKSIGVGAIWITPVQKNRETEFFGGWGYHGYWIEDFMTTDPHVGKLSELRTLIEEAHEKDIKVILDIVVNHAAWDAFPSKVDWFHPKDDIEDWDNQDQLENRSLYGMPDFDQDNPEVFKFLLAMTRFWVNETGCDGIRFDAVKHVPVRFWNRYLGELRRTIVRENPDFLLLGEVLHGDPYYVAEYLKSGFQTVFDFPVYYHLTRAIAGNGSFHSLESELKRDRIYQNPEALVTLLDNHDLPRFVSLCKNNAEQRLKLALTALFMLRGIPSITYGTEIPLYGKEEEAARKDMKFRTRGKIADTLLRLSNLRRRIPSLSKGVQRLLQTSDHILAFTRLTLEDESLCIINANDDFQKIKIPLHKSSVASNHRFVLDKLNNRLFKVEDNHLIGTLPPLSAALINLTGEHPMRAMEIHSIILDRADWPDHARDIPCKIRVYDPDLPDGAALVVTGGHPALGKWKPLRAPILEPAGAGWYEKTIYISEGTDLECKPVRIEGDQPEWHSGANKLVRVKAPDMVININW